MALGEGDLKGKSNLDLHRSAHEVPCVILNTSMPLSLKKHLFCFHLFIFSFLVINNQVRKLWGQYKMKAISKYTAKTHLDLFLPVHLLLDSSPVIEFKCK